MGWLSKKDDILYKSDKKFYLADYVISHGQLLLRADKIQDDSGFNIDIVFSSADYIQIPSHLNSIRITQNVDEKRFGYEQIDRHLGGNVHKVFDIQTQGATYYIVASSFRVFENNLPFGQTSLGVFEPKGREKEIARSF